jgi:hypothetical protein
MVPASQARQAPPSSVKVASGHGSHTRSLAPPHGAIENESLRQAAVHAAQGASAIAVHAPETKNVGGQLLRQRRHTASVSMPHGSLMKKSPRPQLLRQRVHTISAVAVQRADMKWSMMIGHSLEQGTHAPPPWLLFLNVPCIS